MFFVCFFWNGLLCSNTLRHCETAIISFYDFYFTMHISVTFFLGQEGIGDGAGLRLPETYHYLPPGLGHFITRVVPKGIPDESMG